MQGVFFRRTARERGAELGLRVAAANLPDGSVLIEAEGDRAALMRFREWCAVGPPKARVDAVETEEERTLESDTGG